MEVSNRGFLTDTDREDSRYSLQYNRLHLDTLEQKIKEKDQLLLELSSVNQEIYQEMSDLHTKLNLSKQERDTLLQETLNLKDQLLEKNTFIKLQEENLIKLRNQLSQSTNGNSFSLQDKSNITYRSEGLLDQIKLLQCKYDNREDLVIALQEERVNLVKEIDGLRYYAGVIGQITKQLDVSPENILDKIKSSHEQSRYSAGKLEQIVNSLCLRLGCESYEHIVPIINSIEMQMKTYQNTLAKVRQYFHLHASSSLEELDRHIKNLIL